jgi:transposase
MNLIEKTRHVANDPVRRLLEEVLEEFPSCPIPEPARLGRTGRAWRDQVIAYFTTGVSNGGTKAANRLFGVAHAPGVGRGRLGAM